MTRWARQLRLIRVASRQALRYPLRSLLVVGCAAMGVAGAVTAVNYASGGRQQVLEQIQRLGTNVVNVSAQQSRSVAGRARTGAIVTTLRPADYLALRRSLPDIVRGSPVASTSQRVKGAGPSKVTGIVGVEPEWFAIRNWQAARGQLFDDADLRRSARVVVLGAALATDLFGAAAIFVGDPARAQHDRQLRPLVMDHFRQVDAAHARHRQVAHHDVDGRAVPAQRLERLFRSRAPLRGVAEARELCAQQAHQLGLVVDDQHVRRAMRRLGQTG